MLRIYLDESGDMGLNGSLYFIISIIIIKKDYKKLKYIIKRSKRFKFKKIKNMKEIKFYHLSKELRLYFLNELMKIEFNSYSIVLNKKHQEYILQRKNKNEIYIDMIIKLLNHVTLIEPFELTVDNFLPLDKIKELELKILNTTNYKNSKIKQNSSKKSLWNPICRFNSWNLFSKI